MGDQEWMAYQGWTAWQGDEGQMERWEHQVSLNNQGGPSISNELGTTYCVGVIALLILF